MSELKAISSGEIYNIIEYEGSCITDDLYYPKSEADAVIAELKEIDSQNRSAYYKDLAMMAKDVSHHKYKRCLAMAKWCRARYNEWLAYFPTTLTRKMRFLDKWERRWLKLAEQFKE